MYIHTQTKCCKVQYAVWCKQYYSQLNYLWPSKASKTAAIPSCCCYTRVFFKNKKTQKCRHIQHSYGSNAV